jgi:hypothetical protein
MMSERCYPGKMPMQTDSMNNFVCLCTGECQVSVDAIVETNMAGRAPLPLPRLESSLSNSSIALSPEYLTQLCIGQ